MSRSDRRAAAHAAAEQLFWDRRLLEECQQAERCGHTFVLILLSLDGSPAGVSSETVDLVGDSLRTGVRQSDLVARVGPTLYAALLIGANPEFADSVGERLAGHVRSDAGSLVRELATLPLHFGVGVFDGAGETAEALIATAARDLAARRYAGAEYTAPPA
ncbi:MAG TPA: hypothetical protein VKV26_00025 [Dehalococcoidia bacterium]|nr:hypothetical protein [Dehalococcoidia bacterium]